MIGKLWTRKWLGKYIGLYFINRTVIKTEFVDIGKLANEVIAYVNVFGVEVQFCCIK